MATKLRHVEPTKPPGPFGRAYSRMATTRAARFISRHVNWKLDPLLLRATGGRVASTLVFPTAVLETTGASSGKRRRNAIIYFHDPAGDGDKVTIAASNAGAAHHPSWYRNLTANPDVTFGGSPMRAAEVIDPTERERLWALADQVFPAFADYRVEAAAAGREVPLIQLTPR